MRGMRNIPRREEEKKNPYEKHGLKASVSQDGATHIHQQAGSMARRRPGGEEEANAMFEFDPEIQAAFGRNFQFFRRVFTLDTVLQPLPPPMKRGIARSLFSFTRIFTQFFDQKGIVNAQKALGLRPGERENRRTFSR